MKRRKRILLLGSGSTSRSSPITRLISMNDITQILAAAQPGDPKAAEKLLPLVYTELRKLAASKMAREMPGQTLQPTALVHEAWLRVSGPHQQNYQNRG